MCVWVCLCEREKHTQRERVGGCAREIHSACVGERAIRVSNKDVRATVITQPRVVREWVSALE